MDLQKISKKINSTSVSVKAGFWFVICGFIQKSISMISTPIFTRVLSEEEYGISSTFAAWLIIVNLIVTLTLYRSIMNLFVKYENKENVLTYVCGLSITISVIWTIVAVMFSKQLSSLMGLSKSLVIAMFIYSIGESIIQCWMIYKRYTYEYKSAIFVTLLLSFVTCFGGVACVLLIKSTAEWKIYPQVIVYFLVGIIIYFSLFRKNKVFFNSSIWKFSLGFCIGLFPHYISEFILQSSDKIMINYICTSEDVAFYSVAYAVGSLIALFANAINTSFVPYQYQKIQEREFKELSKTANGVQALLALILALLMLFSREIVLIFGGTKYLPCADVIVPICLGVYFNYMFQLFARVQEYYNKKITIVIPSILCAVLNIVLNYIFIKPFGYAAASYTTFFCFALFCFIHYLFYRQTCNKENQGILLYDGRTLFLISIIITIFGAFILVIQEHYFIKYIICLALIIIIVLNRKKFMRLLKK